MSPLGGTCDCAIPLKELTKLEKKLCPASRAVKERYSQKQQAEKYSWLRNTVMLGLCFCYYDYYYYY